MADHEPRPDSVEVAALRTHLQAVWRNAHAEWEKVDTYIHRTYNVWDPPYQDRPSFHPARATSILQHAVDNQMAFEPSIHRSPTEQQSDPAKARADKVEPYLTSVFAETSLLETALTWKQAAYHLIGYGYTVIEGPIMNMDEKPKPPIRQKGEDDEEFSARETLFQNERKTWMPFRIRAPHPAHVLLDPLEKKPRYAIKHAKRFAIELQTLSRARSKKDRGTSEDYKVPTGTSLWTQIMCDEYWTKEWHALFIADGGQEIFVRKNKAGFVPYGHAFSGFGIEPTETKESGIDPKHLAVGILTPILESLKVQAQAHSAVHNSLVEAAFRNEFTQGSAADIQNQRARGATTIELPQGKSSLWWEDMKQLPEWIFQALQLFDQDIELGTFSKSLAGIRQTGVVTVGQQAILSTAAARKFVAPGKQIEHLGTNVASNILRLIDILGETLYCQGHKISPSDIQHDYSLVLKFELLDPIIQMQERQTGMAEHAQGLRSVESYHSLTRLEDHTGELRRLDEDAARALPEVAAIRQSYILLEWGLITKEQQEALQQQIINGQGEGGESGENPGLAGSLAKPRQPVGPGTSGPGRQGFALADNQLDRPL